MRSVPLRGKGSAENRGPENAGLDFEGPFRRSNGIVCSEVVYRNVIQHLSCADNFGHLCLFFCVHSLP